MGLFDLFGRRAERESALSPVPPVSDSAGEPEVIGQRVKGLGDAGGLEGIEALEALGRLGGLASVISKAAEQGNIRISTSFEVHDAGDSQGASAGGLALHEEMAEIMRRHGIDPDSGAVESVDPDTMAEVRREVQELLARREAGLGGGAPGTQVQPPADEAGPGT